MRALIQRVNSASVRVDEQLVGQISHRNWVRNGLFHQTDRFGDLRIKKALIIGNVLWLLCIAFAQGM